MRYKLKTAAVNPPVSTSDMKNFLRVVHSEDDTEIAAQVLEAKKRLQNWTGRVFINEVWYLYLDKFPVGDEITLEWPPLVSVDSITYTDENGTTGQTFSSSNYEVSTSGDQGRVRLLSGQSWPNTKDLYDAVTIEFTAGYGANASDVPEDIKAAIKLKVGDLYENRQDQVVGATNSITLKDRSYDLLQHYVVRPFK